MVSVNIIPVSDIGTALFPTTAALDLTGWSRNVEIELPPEALLDNSENGLVRMVFFTYNNLEELLQSDRVGVYPSNTPSDTSKTTELGKEFTLIIQP